MSLPRMVGIWDCLRQQNWPEVAETPEYAARKPSGSLKKLQTVLFIVT